MAPVAERLAELLEADTSAMTALERAEHMAELERARHQLDAEVLVRLHSFEVSGAFDVDAARNPTSWLVEQTGASRRDAASRTRLAGQLPQMPLTLAACLEGRVTEAHARVMARCVANPRVRPYFTEVEEDRLLEQAEQKPADEFAYDVDRWIALVDQDGPEPRDRDRDVLHVNRVGDRVKVNGDFGLETGLPLMAAVEERSNQLFHRDKKVSEENPGDGASMRTPGERRAEALYDLTMWGAGNERNPAHREPLFIVNVDWDTWDEGLHAESVIELFDGSPIPYDVMRRLRCGSHFQELVRSAAGEVLHLFREERYVNRAQRRALAARDRGCGVPGCTHPPHACDAHHIRWWEDFGETNLDNLVLTCRYHHRMIHAGKLSVIMLAGMPVFFDQFGEQIGRGRRRPPPDASAA